MKLTGLVTEYNPFHNGHQHHLKESVFLTNATHTVAIMSGHFLQRGEIALCDKWSRASAAVASGVDLVIELPSVFAASSAEHFARGAIQGLSAMGCNSFCFGSEEGTLPPLLDIAKLLSYETPEYKEKIKIHLQRGLSYPAARQVVIESILSKPMDSKSNNILGIEYLKANLQLKSQMIPCTIKRLGSSYSEEQLTGQISSATAIRKFLESENSLRGPLEQTLPTASIQMLQNALKKKQLVFQEQLYPFIQYQILTENEEKRSEIYDVSEGLHHRLFKAALKSDSLCQLIETTKTKRYTRTRIQRALINLLLKRDKHMMNTLLFSTPFPYLRILAYNQKGKEIIRYALKKHNAPFLTNPNKFSKWTKDSKAFFDEDVKSTNLFRLIQGKNITGEDFRTKPVEVDDK